MFKAVIKGETFKSLVYIVSTIVDEAKITVSPEGLSIKAIDAGRIALLDIKVTPDAFLSFEADMDEIGLDLEKVKVLLKLADASDDIYMEHDADQGRLVFRIGNIVRRMSLVDTASMGDPKVPALEIPDHVVLTADVLKKGIKASESIADHISLKADPDGFEVSCQGDTDYVSLRVPASDLVTFEVSKEIKSMYNLDFFSNIVKVIPDKTEVDVHLESDFPVQLLFGLAEGAIAVTYLLAPRVESE